MSTVILTILGRFDYSEINFYDKETAEAVNSKLAAEAYCILKANKECNIVFFVPESLVQMIENDIYKAKELLEDPVKLKEEIGLKIKENQLINESNIKYKVKIIPSIGEYPGDNSYHLVFKQTTLDDVEASLLIDIIEETQGYKKIIGDYTIGQNIYTVALNNALKELIIYNKIRMLDNILYKENKHEKTEYHILQMPPVLNRTFLQKDIKHFIYHQEMKAKYFMEYPLNINEIHNTQIIDILNTSNQSSDEKKRIGKKYSHANKIMRNLLKIGLYLNNTLKYNAPLAGLYYKEILFRTDKKFKEIIENLDKEIGETKKIIKELIEEGLKPKVSIKNNNTLEITRIGTNKQKLRNIIYGIETAHSLSRLYNKINNENINEECYPLYSIAFLKKIFKDNIYKASFFGPNKFLLAKDLSDYETGKAKKDTKKHDPDERTFFAHSGMPEGYITKKACIGYNEDVFNEYYEKIFEFMINVGV